MGGHPAQTEKIRPWAKKKLFLIEDSAESCGTFYKGRKLEHGQTLHALVLKKKIITTGDGGMICLNDKKMYEKIKSLSFHGWNKDPWSRHKKSFFKKKEFTKHWLYEIENLGYKYNMHDYMAALGLAQLKKK